MKKTQSSLDHTEEVDQFMQELDHPLKPEVQMIRGVIKGVNKEITEQIKWKAPSFSYQGEYLVTFNLRTTEHIHLVFHNPMIAQVKSKLLEGDYKDRRMAYFLDMKDVLSKKAALEKALKDLIKLQKEKDAPMKKTDPKENSSASQQIDRYINGLADWRGALLARLRKIILEAAPELSEEWKWDTPVWSYKGNVVAGGAFKDHIKLNFFKGTSLRDPSHLFNAGLEAKATRGIDFHEGDQVDEAALKELVQEAVAFNKSGGKK